MPANTGTHASIQLPAPDKFVHSEIASPHSPWTRWAKSFERFAVVAGYTSLTKLCSWQKSTTLTWPMQSNLAMVTLS